MMKTQKFRRLACTTLACLLAALCFAYLFSGCSKNVVISNLWNFKKYPALDAKETGLAYVLDSNGNPRVVYHSDSALNYAVWTGSSWKIQEIAKESYLGWYSTQLLLDKFGKPHIVYESTFNKHLQYGRLFGDKWILQSIQQDGTAACMDLIYQMEPRVSYIARTDGYIKYAEPDGDTWKNTPLAYSGIHSSKEKYPLGIRTALAIDSSGNCNIVYMNYNDSELYYLRKIGETWGQPEIIDKGGEYTGIYASMVLDKKDKPQVIYVAPEQGGVRFASLLSAGWSAKTIDDRGGLATFMTLNIPGSPCAVYFTPGYRELRYSAATMWSPEIVEDRRALANPKNTPSNPYLTFDLRGRPHILYYDFERKQLCHYQKI